MWNRHFLCAVMAASLVASGGPPIAENVFAADAGTGSTDLQLRAPTDYFPDSLSEPTIDCGPGWKSRFSIISADEERSWSRYLAKAGEPSLAPRAGAAHRAGTVTLRFTWLRSFDPPAIVRVETAADGGQTVIATKFAGRAHFHPAVETTLKRPLSGAEMTVLRTILERARPFDLDPAIPCDGVIVLDGAAWIYELADDDGYRLFHRTSPPPGRARELGEFLLKLTGWDLDPIY